MQPNSTSIGAVASVPPAGPATTLVPNGGAVSQQQANALADLGLPVMGAQPRSEREDGRPSVPTKLGPVEALMTCINQERMDAINFRRMTRDPEWTLFRKNLSMEVTRRNPKPNSGQDGAPSSEYTTSELMLPKALEVHNRATADLLRMMCPIGGYPFGLKVRRDGAPDPDLTNAVREVAKQQFDGMDYGKLAKELAPDMMQFGFGVVDGPMLPPADEVEWKLVGGQMEPVPGSGDKQCWFEHISPEHVYPDPSVSWICDSGVFHIQCSRTVWQMEQLRETVEDPSGIEKTLEKEPFLIEAQTVPSETPDARKRYDIWRRVGFLTKKHFDLMKNAGHIKADQKHKPGACWDIWYDAANGHVIDAKIRKTRPNKLPIRIVPMTRIKGKYWPLGLQDVMAPLQDLLDRCSRAIDDQLGDLSSVNALINPNRVMSNDYKLTGRKVWFLKEDELALGDESKSKPFEFFTIPNNLKELLSVAGWILGLIPEITGLPSYAFQPAAVMGSGVRTEGQQTQLFESAATWIRHVMGTVDEYLIEPMVSGAVDFAIRNGLVENFEGMVKVIPEGMPGAIKREIMVRKLMSDMATVLQPLGLVDFLDKMRVPQLLMDVNGFGDDNLILSPAKYAEATAAVLMRGIAEAEAAKAAPQSHEITEKKQASIRDTLGQAFDAIMSNDAKNPAASVVFEQLMESCGRANRPMYAATDLWRRRDAMLAVQLGTAQEGDENLAILTQPSGPENPAELEPGSDPAAPAPTMDPMESPSGRLVAKPDEQQAMPPQDPAAMAQQAAIGMEESGLV